MPFILNDPTQTSPEIHVGDVGSRFLMTIYNQQSGIVDLSEATSLTLVFRNSAGDVSNKTAELLTDGTDGVMYYQFQTGDIDIDGQWGCQGVLQFGAELLHTNIVDFTVYKNLSD